VALGALISLWRENSFLNNSIRMFCRLWFHILFLDSLWRDQTYPFGVMLFLARCFRDIFSGPPAVWVAFRDLSRYEQAHILRHTGKVSKDKIWTIIVKCKGICGT
jgi:hypothetical protein